MVHGRFTTQHRAIGAFAAWAVSILLVAYAVTMVLGFVSLQSPDDPIGDPYFTIMELLIILIVPLMVLCMVSVHAYAPPGARAYSLAALGFMALMAGISSTLGLTRRVAGILPRCCSWEALRVFDGLGSSFEQRFGAWGTGCRTQVLAAAW